MWGTPQTSRAAPAASLPGIDQVAISKLDFISKFLRQRMFPSNLINYVAQRFSSEQGCDLTNLATRRENKQPNLPLIKDLISRKFYRRDQILRNRHLFPNAEAVPHI